MSQVSQEFIGHPSLRHHSGRLIDVSIRSFDSWPSAISVERREVALISRVARKYGERWVFRVRSFVSFHGPSILRDTEDRLVRGSAKQRRHMNQPWALTVSNRKQKEQVSHVRWTIRKRQPYFNARTARLVKLTWVENSCEDAIARYHKSQETYCPNFYKTLEDKSV